nr:oxidoreductase [Roseovarius sp.]
LTRALVARGRDVRVLSRGTHGPFADLAEQVETCAVSLGDEAGLRAAMEGIDVVFNLARALGTTWQECLENDVAVSDRIARARPAHG